MANEENLKHFTSDQSREEAVKNGKKGGKMSGAARRRRKTMEETAKLLLNMPTSNATANTLKEAFGIDEKDATYQMAVLAKMVQEAAGGNIKAAEFLRDTMGENPKTKIEGSGEVSVTKINIVNDTDKQ